MGEESDCCGILSPGVLLQDRVGGGVVGPFYFACSCWLVSGCTVLVTKVDKGGYFVAVDAL